MCRRPRGREGGIDCLCIVYVHIYIHSFLFGIYPKVKVKHCSRMCVCVPCPCKCVSRLWNGICQCQSVLWGTQLKTHAHTPLSAPVSMAKHVCLQSVLSVRSVRLWNALSGFQSRSDRLQFQLLQRRQISRQAQLFTGSQNDRWVPWKLYVLDMRERFLKDAVLMTKT